MKRKSDKNTFSCLVLAAGRGKDDPMAAAFQVEHKCLLPIKGEPMINRVLEALSASPSIGDIAISIETDKVLHEDAKVKALIKKHKISMIKSKDRASTSVKHAADELPYPLLVTTADHALLTPEILDDFVQQATAEQCDLAVGLVHESVIKAAYPDVKRTYLRFNDGGYSGANLFALMTPESLKVVEFWQYVEKERKRPWKLISAFGLMPFIKWLAGRLSLEGAFLEASIILKADVRAITLQDAQASIDVDKPSDHDLVEKILKQ